MSTYSFFCPKCSAQVKLKAELDPIGKKVKCKKCTTVFPLVEKTMSPPSSSSAGQNLKKKSSSSAPKGKGRKAKKQKSSQSRFAHLKSDSGDSGGSDSPFGHLKGGAGGDGKEDKKRRKKRRRGKRPKLGDRKRRRGAGAGAGNVDGEGSSFLAKFFTFQGRIGRLSYFLRSLAVGFMFMMYFIVIILVFAGSGAGRSAEGPLTALIALGYLAVIYSQLCLAGKRFHDLGVTAFMSILAIFIPLVGLFLLFIKGNNGPNKYGPDPLRSGLSNRRRKKKIDRKMLNKFD